MTAIVIVYGKLCRVENTIWSSDDKGLERLLNASVDSMASSPSVPDPDRLEAERAVRDFGATIVRVYPVQHVRGKIY